MQVSGHTIDDDNDDNDDNHDNHDNHDNYDNNDNDDELGDANCVPEKQYNTMQVLNHNIDDNDDEANDNVDNIDDNDYFQAGITAGISLAVLVPVACCIVCLLQRYMGGGAE